MWQAVTLVAPTGAGCENILPLVGLLAESEESVYREVQWNDFP